MVNDVRVVVETTRLTLKLREGYNHACLYMRTLVIVLWLLTVHSTQTRVLGITRVCIIPMGIRSDKFLPEALFKDVILDTLSNSS